MGLLALEVLSPLGLTKREDGRDVFKLWQTHLPELLPDRFGNWEPLDKVFDPSDIEAVLDQWKRPLLTKRRQPFVTANIWMRKENSQRKLHAAMIIEAELKATSQPRLLAFLEAASIRLRADFACLHLFTDPEYQRGHSNKTVSALDKQGKKLRFFLASPDLLRRLPDIYWATVFGTPYLEMFGEDRVLSAPVYRKASLSGESVLLQLTEKLTDIEERPDFFNDLRLRVKNHLGKDAFFDQGIEPHSVYRAPTFKFSDDANDSAYGGPLTDSSRPH